jgi:cysteine desulfurase
LRDKLSNLDGIIINSSVDASPYILNISVPNYRSETLLHFLEGREIFVSSGSACAKGKGSHVLGAMGLDRKIIDGALRISFSKENTKEDIDAFCDALILAKKILRTSAR